MLTTTLKNHAAKILEHADIHINGGRPWDIEIRNPGFFGRVLRQGSLGFGESYMDGWWDVPALDEFFEHLFRVKLGTAVFPGWRAIRLYLFSLLSNPQKKSRAFQIGEGHYDRGNDLFERMLDPRMVYTCANWERASNLAEAQEAKLAFVCHSIGASRGMKILDIGCGWGSFARFAAEKYGAQVTGITVSAEQARLASEKCKGLPIEIRLVDYRDVHENFDAVVSLGMFEHVGHKNYRRYLEVVQGCLACSGRFYLSTIGKDHAEPATDPWIEKYIFPNSVLPSLKQISVAADGLFTLEEMRNWGHYYDQTLMAWFHNFETSWDTLRGKYGERFFRMWKFYLMCSAGSFRAERLHVWQMVFSPSGAHC